MFDVMKPRFVAKDKYNFNSFWYYQREHKKAVLTEVSTAHITFYY